MSRRRRARAKISKHDKDAITEFTEASGIEIELKLKRERRLKFRIASAEIAD
jgi:hypothetical protein